MLKSRIILIALFAAFLFCLSLPISDPDLFWHLATGRWIWEHGQLPENDPFNYTTSPRAYEEFLSTRIIPRQYWLANLLQYGSYAIGGYWGLLALRLVVACLTLLFVYLHLRKKDLSVIASVFLLIPLSYIFVRFVGDRPNQMTFFFLAAFMYLIENLKSRCKIQDTNSVPASCIMDHASSFSDRGSWIVHHASLPVLMLFWANMHGGFIVGSAVAGVYILSESLRTVLDPGHKLRKPLIIVPAVTILAGLVNPNGYYAVYTLIKESLPVHKASVMELKTPFAFLALGTYRYLVAVVAYIAAATLSTAMFIVKEYRIRNSESGNTNSLSAALLHHCEEVLLVVLFGFLSLTAVRVIPLLGIVLSPFIAQMFSGKPDLLFKRLSRFLVPEIAIVVTLVLAIWSIYPSTILKTPLVTENLPEPAVSFMKENDLKGRLFNFYDWGGYLIWRFYPDKVVFMDGRTLSQRAYLQYASVIGGDTERIMGVPAYKAILDTYSVRNILIPGSGVDGGFDPLITVLVEDPEWRLIFYSKNCLLFTREVFEPDFPKALSYAVALESARTFIGSDNPRPYLTIVRADLGLGRRGEAIEFLKEALTRKPSLKGGPVERALNLLNEGKDILHEDLGLP